MKGFLSLLGITLIVGAFGLILLSYSGNPLEELKSQERMYAYMETRQNHPTEETEVFNTTASPVNTATAKNENPYRNFDESCEKPFPPTKKADSD
ncbi:hypothetical protein QWY16_02050 [Planococcus shenhongbingii]|uniref:DUF3951 domain-containing protein n=1 Tax=Planococcus shenhongbingii TaxID=3058398 RepID=A0ABT8NFK3_9BACL|nr:MULTISPECIES: hypothetical protein [unclassified Planococcus (in: firmicutes)]MDN7246676.1 hypothetical protein [Planococcus sp. N017]WKA58964.1 hypothetical protein QWY16_02050 [Planococcus sp. N016]